MSAEDKPGEPHGSIIIVKRGGGGHDDHHGGAWKIAYADFMTAMMALFLVLWLVNASSEETKAAVASYFNPIDLTDRNARPRGLADPIVGPAEVDEGGDVAVHGEETSPTEAAETTRSADETEAGEDPTPGTGVAIEVVAGAPPSAAEARDPFAPDAWSQAVNADETVLIVPQVEGASVAAASAPGEKAAEEPETSETAGGALPSEDELEQDEGPETAEASGLEVGETDEEMASETRTVVEPGPDPRDEALAEAIAAELADALGTVTLEVVPERGAVVIRLTDDPKRPMFALGSDRPRSGLDADLRRVAEALRERPGSVSLHGHTDARPFAGRADGNWLLSADRARVAHELLLSGGLEPGRVVAITAHADRDPKDPANPLSAANRRIELRLSTSFAREPSP